MRKFNILIVDDIAENIEVLGTILSREGYQIGIAANGPDALVRAGSGIYDIILLDIIMPEMDGFEVCRRLRADGHTKNIPVIFLSARIDKESIVEGFNAGGQDYVTKPFNAAELLARVKTHIDLSEKTKSLEEMNRTLEVKVEQRTRELSRAHSKLSTLERAKNDFLALISHEIRTPLNGIVNLIEILSEVVTTDLQQEFIDDLKESIDRLIRFSETALLVTSLKAHREKLALSRLQLRPFIDLCVTQMKEKAAARNLTLTAFSIPEQIFVPADRDMMKICLHNVLFNAIKYSDEGGIITLDTAVDDEEVRILISDDGPGLSESARAFLFDLFSSGDIQHHSEGFGLGLAAARLIMESHGGGIEVHERPERGICVILSLPRYRKSRRSGRGGPLIHAY